MPHQAPQPDAMRVACLRARQFWHQQYPDLAIRLHIEEVPQFVPGLGSTGESYRVGAIQLVEAGDFLTVYLDTMSGRVRVEQPLLEIPAPDELDPGPNLGH